jgi:hypothetical protein
MAKKVVSEPMLNGACTRSHHLFPRSFPTGQTLRELFQSHKQTASKKKADFTRNRTRPMTKINPFPLSETDTKATGNEVRDLPCEERKGENPTRGYDFS